MQNSSRLGTTNADNYHHRRSSAAAADDDNDVASAGAAHTHFVRRKMSGLCSRSLLSNTDRHTNHGRRPNQPRISHR